VTMSKRTEMARTFAVSSQKGGVGKTTTAANLAAVWSEAGVRVLAVDFDPQFALTRSLGWAPSDAQATAVDVIAGHSELGAAAVNVRAGLDLLCGHRDLAKLELTLVAQTKREEFLARALKDSLFDYDVITGNSTLRKQQEVLGGYDPKQYASERLWATARDGVKVPVSIVYKRGFARDGKGSLFLYGYGSYGIGTPPTFSSNRVSLLNRGMAYAIAHIRGGDEMGEKWREDGMLMKKKNTFFDFIDCAEFLIRQKWTSKDRLVIEGGSAGGLLMGAVVNARPDLFKAVHAAVPFVDVMNTMMDATLPLTVGEYLEWGNPNEKAAYDYMKTYSPYDNLEKRAYPAILVTTSFNDSQVMYWEPAKYVARLRTILDDTGRPMLFINWNTDMGDGWEWSNAQDYPGYIKYTAMAYRMGINEIVYALTH